MTKSDGGRRTADMNSLKISATSIEAKGDAIKDKALYDLSNRKFPSRSWFRWFMAKHKSPYKNILVNMELRNGHHVSFIEPLAGQSFKFMGGEYIFDEDVKYFHISSGLWACDYHQDFSLPVKRKLPINEVSKTIKSMSNCEVELMLNPATLEQFVKSKIAEFLMKAIIVDEYLKSMKLIVFITMIATLILLVLFIYKTGMLQGISLKGFNFGGK